MRSKARAISLKGSAVVVTLEPKVILLPVQPDTLTHKSHMTCNMLAITKTLTTSMFRKTMPKLAEAKLENLATMQKHQIIRLSDSVSEKN